MDINWQGLIAGAVTVFVITYFTKKATFAAKEGELKFGMFMKGLGLVCLLFSVVPFVVLLTGNYQIDKPGETTALIGLSIGFGIGAFHTLVEGFFSKVAMIKNQSTFQLLGPVKRARSGMICCLLNLMVGATGMYLNLKAVRLSVYLPI